MSTSIVLTGRKGQANFTNNALMDPKLVMHQLFISLRPPTHKRKQEIVIAPFVDVESGVASQAGTRVATCVV